MNNVYLYNYSFKELISLIFYLLKNKIKPSNIKDSSYNPNLFEECIFLNVKSNEDDINNIVEQFGEYAFRCIYFVYLSTNEFKELIIYYFILNALKYRKKITYMRNLKCVHEALRISEYVMHESHKMKGFTRFKEINNNILYAEMEPVNNILELVSKHFQKRLKNEYWIIKDVKRKMFSIYDKKRFYIVLEESFKLNDFTFSTKEKEIKEMWQLFYKTIGIKERKNERCRRNFMPKRYWKYLIEMEDEL